MSELYEERENETNKLEEAVKKIVFTEEFQNKKTEKIEEGNCCSICLEETNKRPQLIMTTECGHTFHYRECWKKYYETSNDSKINTICRPCPMCRRLIMYETGSFFNTLEYIKALEEAIVDAVDIDFQPLFYETDDTATHAEDDLNRIVELRPIVVYGNNRNSHIELE